jgi:hypothetical protein
VAANERWEVRLYETLEGRTPVRELLIGLPAKHRARVRQAIGRLEVFGPGLGFPDTSAVKNASFRELRTRFAGQQYRVLYVQDSDAFVLFTGFHKTSDCDLDHAVSDAEKYLTDYRSRKERG